MGVRKLDQVKDRPTDEYLVQTRDHRISETFNMRDQRYAEVDSLLRGEFGYKLPGNNMIVEPPMVMNLGLAFTQDVARLVTEQSPVYRSPVYADTQKAEEEASLREVVGHTYWVEGRGDLTIQQQAMDLVVCGAAYLVCYTDDGDYPHFVRVDPRQAYPNLSNGIMHDLLVVSVVPAAIAEHLFPDFNIGTDAQSRNLKDEVEIWQYYETGYAIQAVAHVTSAGAIDTGGIKRVKTKEYGIDCPPAVMVQLPTHDGAMRGSLDQIGNSLQAKNKIASLLTKYTEHKVFAPWESKGVLNPKETPGPNTVYLHDDAAPGETFMRRVDPAGSDPALFSLMNLLDLDQRGGIGYPASRQGEVGQSIASAAFVESTQGQLSSITKNVQNLLGDLRAQATEVMFKMDVSELDFDKPLDHAIGKKKTYQPSKDIGKHTKIRVIYGAGAGLSRQNADTRIINLLGARLIDRGTARDNLEFLRDRTDIQDRIEMENAEDALQQLFWPDPAVPIDVKFQVKKLMLEKGLNLTAAWDEVQAQVAKMQEEQAQAQQQAQAQAAAPVEPGAPSPTAADEQALALEKGAIVEEPADIDLPPAPMEQIFINNG